MTQEGVASSRVTYDSDERLSPLLGVATSMMAFRGLIRLLVTRDLTVRYKRSVLGVWWTLINPLLTATVMWVVFNQVFRFQIPGVPFIVYLLSGVILLTFFAQGLIVVGNSIVGSTGIITKVYVPPEVFAFSAAISIGVNFCISLLVLLIVQLLTGVGIPLTALLVPVPVLLMLALITGAGLLVATLAIRYSDVMDLTVLLVTLLGYLTPTFYPVSIIPEDYRDALYINPVYSFLLVFRGLVYEGSFATWPAWTIMTLVSLGALGLGAYVFNRRWRHLAAML